MYIIVFSSTSVCICFFFFFSSRRRHTRFDCDWSSDVCSSDLCPQLTRFRAVTTFERESSARKESLGCKRRPLRPLGLPNNPVPRRQCFLPRDRKSVV